MHYILCTQRKTLTRNLRINNTSTVCYKVLCVCVLCVIRTINKLYELRKYSNINYNVFNVKLIHIHGKKVKLQ